MTTLNILEVPTPPFSHVLKALRVTAFGDSLIYGYGDPINGGWVEQLRRQWMSSRKNLAVSSTT